MAEPSRPDLRPCRPRSPGRHGGSIPAALDPKTRTSEPPHEDNPLRTNTQSQHARQNAAMPILGTSIRGVLFAFFTKKVRKKGLDDNPAKEKWHHVALAGNF